MDSDCSKHPHQYIQAQGELNTCGPDGLVKMTRQHPGLPTQFLNAILWPFPHRRVQPVADISGHCGHQKPRHSFPSQSSSVLTRMAGQLPSVCAQLTKHSQVQSVLAPQKCSFQVGLSHHIIFQNYRKTRKF